MKNEINVLNSLLNGQWHQIYINEDGIENPHDDKGLGSISEFCNGIFNVWSLDGALVLAGSYNINSIVRPAEIDWTDSIGSDKGKTFLSIFTLTKNTFEFIAANEGMARPINFDPGFGYTIRRFKRVDENA